MSWCRTASGSVLPFTFTRRPTENCTLYSPSRLFRRRRTGPQCDPVSSDRGGTTLSVGAAGAAAAGVSRILRDRVPRECHAGAELLILDVLAADRASAARMTTRRHCGTASPWRA